jgi:dTDP-4-amino-4,6-dideoxygalactose transaminase
MEWKIPLSDVDFGNEEKNAVIDVLESKWLTMGAVTQQFEREIAAYTGAKHAIAVSNGTAALHLACLAIGLKHGDEAIVPSLTFVATANAVRYTGASPVFADIHSESDLTIDPESITRNITNKTRAILVMHYGGYACDMPKIMQIAQEYGLHVIEDAAHAIGSYLDQRMMGTWGDIGCFSFFSNKNLITGEGGMLVTDNDELAEKLSLLRSHGMTTLTWDRHKGHAWSYDVVDLGYNYRTDEIHAALGRVQLAKLEKNNQQRSHLTQVYRESLQQTVPEVGIPFIGHSGYSAAHLMPVLLPTGMDRTRFMESLKSKGIQTSIHYPPIHLFSSYRFYADQQINLPHTEDVAMREVTLPLYPTLKDEEVKAVVRSMKEFIDG